VSTDRVCECGCGRPMHGMRPEARYATDACRTRHWKAKRMDPRDRKRKSDRERIARRRAQGVPLSDMRVSYGRAIEVLADHFEQVDGGYRLDAIERAEAVLRQALPARLRGDGGRRAAEA
jgi:hypothetical protein